MVADLVREGWTYQNGSHPRVTAPNGTFVTFSDTPSDCNAHKQFARDIQKVKAGRFARSKVPA